MTAITQHSNKNITSVNMFSKVMLVSVLVSGYAGVFSKLKKYIPVKVIQYKATAEIPVH